MRGEELRTGGGGVGWYWAQIPKLYFIYAISFLLFILISYAIYTDQDFYLNCIH